MGVVEEAACIFECLSFLERKSRPAAFCSCQTRTTTQFRCCTYEELLGACRTNDWLPQVGDTDAESGFAKQRHVLAKQNLLGTRNVFFLSRANVRTPAELWYSRAHVFPPKVALVQYFVLILERMFPINYPMLFAKIVPQWQYDNNGDRRFSCVFVA